MPSNKRLPSLRWSVIIALSVSLVIFLSLFYYICQSAMSQMVLNSETRFMMEQLEIVRGVFESETGLKEDILKNISQWDETVEFLDGENPDYVSDNWHNSPIVEILEVDIIAFKDASGHDLLLEGMRTGRRGSRALPDGISEHFTQLVENLRERYLGGTLGDEPFLSGIVQYNNIPYYVFASLVFGSGERSVDTAGSVVAAIQLSGRYFAEATHMPDTNFNLSATPEISGAEDLTVSRLGDHLIEATLPLHDINGSIMRLTLTLPRTAYKAGMSEIGNSITIMLAVVAAFTLAIYLVLTRRILRPIEYLAADIEEKAMIGGIDSSDYSKNREFEALCRAINDMVSRLDESKISLEVVNTILNSLDALIYVTDVETREILFANHRLLETLGIEEDVLGKHCDEVGDEGIFGSSPAGELPVGGAVTRETRSVNTGRYYRNTDSLIKWTGGRAAHLGYAVDITAEKESGESMKKRLEQQELMSAMSQSFISTADTDVLIQNALRMTGEFMDASKILAMSLNRETEHLEIVNEWYNPNQDVQPPSQRAFPFKRGSVMFDDIILKNKSCLAYDRIDGLEAFSQYTKGGAKSIIAVPIYVSGVFWGIISIEICDRHYAWSGSDIHLVRLIGSVISGVISRKLTEDNLIRMSSIVDSSPQFIAYIQPDGKFRYMNDGAARISGYSREKLAEDGIGIIFGAGDKESFFRQFVPGIIEKDSHGFETPIARGDGEERILFMSGFTTGNDDGLAIIASDITENRKLERELVAAKEQAEQGSRAKSDFLSRMSHEMRTPMNAIIGMTAIAHASNDPEKQVYCLDKIEEASQHLLGVINDILDMSKIEAAKFELDFTEFDFEKMLLRVANVINFRVDEREQSFIIDIDPSVPKIVISDEQRFAQVLTNLLSNAVKFTPERGTIRLNASAVENGDGSRTIKVEVSDTGIGITPEQQRRLFRSFEQADGGIARKFGGTGLGLAISKSIVELMGGEIWVESEVDRGTSFFFTVTVRPGEHPEPWALLPPDVSWETLRILVVDDAPDVREYFETFCGAAGLRCVTADSGERALELIGESTEAPFSIVFVDLHMPGMDGVELSRVLKRKYGRELIVIMVSSSVWSDVKDRAMDAGVDHFIPKPLFSSEIVNCINSLMGLRSTRTGEESSEDSLGGIFSGKRILLVEDVEINREIVISLLEETEIAIDSASDGREAVEIFSANPGAYDLIFMDIHMPEVDGYEATRRIRALDNEWAASVPICAMTANVFREDVDRCFEAGMNAHVGKPVNFDEIIKILKTYLG